MYGLQSLRTGSFGNSYNLHTYAIVGDVVECTKSEYESVRVQ